LDELSKTTTVPPPAISFVHLGLGDVNAAMEYIEQSYRERWAEIVFIKAGPPYAVLRSDPRFNALLAKMRFPE
jgi:serine/threonine-protein kinase